MCDLESLQWNSLNSVFDLYLDLLVAMVSFLLLVDPDYLYILTDLTLKVLGPEFRCNGL